MENNFKINSYTARHDFGCSECKHCMNPLSWPDKNKEIRCSFNGKSLAVILNEEGYLDAEWFCKNIDYKRMPDFHREELERISSSLKNGFIYRMDMGELTGLSFEEI